MGFEQIQVELQEVMGNDRAIAEAAWTSSYTVAKKELKDDEDVARVIKMLASSDPPHGVPFESVIFRFWVRMPIATDRQHATHRIQSMNGLSGRYRTMPSDFYTAPDDILEIMKKLDKTAPAPEMWASWLYDYNQVCTDANEFYRSMVARAREAETAGALDNKEMKRLREFFRGVLPQHAMTERTTLMNLRSFANYQKQRNDDHAQPEIRNVAQKMLAAVEACGRIPVALECLKANAWRI